MKTITCLLAVVVLFLSPRLRAQDTHTRKDIEKDIPLAEAIRRVNEQFPSAQPITEDEVIAAVQAIKLTHPNIREATYVMYQRVAKERVLPRGMYFEHTPGWHTAYGHFVVDWIDLALTSLPVGRKDSAIGYGFNYRIRARFISSRPLTEEEARALKEKAKMVEQGHWSEQPPRFAVRGSRASATRSGGRESQASPRRGGCRSVRSLGILCNSPVFRASFVRA